MTEIILDAAPDLDFDLKGLPKVSLHDHLDGGLRPATIIELAEAAGHTLPSTDPVALGEWFRESADSGSLVRYLEPSLTGAPVAPPAANRSITIVP